MVPRPPDDGDRLASSASGPQLVHLHQSLDHPLSLLGAHRRYARFL
jgi:hypothetical protein